MKTFEQVSRFRIETPSSAHDFLPLRRQLRKRTGGQQLLFSEVAYGVCSVKKSGKACAAFERVRALLCKRRIRNPISGNTLVAANAQAIVAHVARFAQRLTKLAVACMSNAG